MSTRRSNIAAIAFASGMAMREAATFIEDEQRRMRRAVKLAS
jgi:hypothetical protein